MNIFSKKGQIRIEYMPVDDLVGMERNPKEHDLGAIHASINRFGYVAPIIINETTGRIVAGHGRAAVLKQKQDAGEDRPSGVMVKDGKARGPWLAPVVRGVAFKSDKEAEAYLIADNRLTELGGWDNRTLLEILDPLSVSDGLDGTGFDQDDLESLRKSLDPLDAEVGGTGTGGGGGRGLVTCPECGHEFELGGGGK